VLLGMKNANDGDDDDVPVPGILDVQMADLPLVQAYLSPTDGHFDDVNVIGMDLLSQLRMTILGKDRSFVLENIEEHIVA
jgi:hypothetical protein